MDSRFDKYLTNTMPPMDMGSATLATAPSRFDKFLSTPSPTPSFQSDDDILKQAVAGAVGELVPFGLTKRLGEKVAAEPKTTKGKIARTVGGLAGSIPTFLLAGEIAAPLKGLSFFSKLSKVGEAAKLAEEAGKLSPILSKGAQMIAPAAKEALTGAAFGALQTQKPEELPKNVAAGAAGFAPFGAAEVPASALGKFLTLLGGTSAVESIKEGKLTPQTVLSALPMAALGLVGPKKLTGKLAKDVGEEVGKFKVGDKVIDFEGAIKTIESFGKKKPNNDLSHIAYFKGGGGMPIQELKPAGIGEVVSGVEKTIPTVQTKAGLQPLPPKGTIVQTKSGLARVLTSWIHGGGKGTTAMVRLVDDKGLPDYKVQFAVGLDPNIKDAGETITKSLFAAKSIKKAAQPQQEEVVNKIVDAVYAGDMEKAKQIYDKFSSFMKIPSPQEVTGQTEREVAQGAKEATAGKVGDLGAEYKKLVSIVKSKGEQLNPATGMLYREHVPAGKNLGMSSDEIATDLGMSENELMQMVLNDIAAPQRTTSASMKARKPTSGPAVSVPKTISMQQQVQPGFGVGEETGMNVGPIMSGPKGTMLPISKELSPGQLPGEEMDQFIAQLEKTATPAQVSLLNALRKRAGIRLSELQKAGITEGSLKKLSESKAKELITFAQPKNIMEDIMPAISGVREKAAETRYGVVKAFNMPLKSTSKLLETAAPQVSKLQEIVNDVKNLAGSIKQSKALGKKSTNPLSFLIPFLPEQLAAKVAGVSEEFFSHASAINGIAERYGSRIKEISNSVLLPLTEEQRRAVVFVSQHIPVPKELFKMSKEKPVQDAAKKLNELMDIHYEFSNWFRSIAGKGPMPKKQNYLPWVLSQQVKDILGEQGTRVRFQDVRTKETQDFLAGLFEQDPMKIFDALANSSTQYAKANLYNGILKKRIESLGGLEKISPVAKQFGQQIENLDIYGRPSDTNLYFRQGADATANLINNLIPGNKKTLEISPALKKSLDNTFWRDQLNQMYDAEGKITVPKIDVGRAISAPFVQLPYLLKLSFNIPFGILNITQPQLGISTMGLKSFVQANKRFFGMVMGKEPQEYARVQRILEELGVLSKSVYGGEATGLQEIKAKGFFKKADGTNMNLAEITQHSLTSVGRLTEFYNRMVSFLQSEEFLKGKIAKGAEAGGIKPLSRKEMEKVSTQVSIFYNFLSGKFHSPAAQRNPLGQALYVFNQYPLNILDVYHEGIKHVAGKDPAAQAFWRRMAQEGGASKATLDAFNSLTTDTKKNVGNLMLAATLPVATVLLLTQNWEMAKRAFPGQSRFSVANPQIKLMQAAMLYYQDPEKNADDFRKAIEDYFEPVAIKRVWDAMQGGPKTPSGKLRYEITDDEKIRAALFGSTVTKGYKEYKKGIEKQKESTAKKSSISNLLYTMGLLSNADIGKAVQQIRGKSTGSRVIAPPDFSGTGGITGPSSRFDKFLTQ